MKVLLRIFLVLIGLAVGPGLLALVFEIMRSTGTDLEASIQPLLLIAIYAASSLVTGIIIFLLSKRISDKIYNGLLKIEDEATKVPAYVVAGAIAGLIAGLIIAALLSWAIGMIPLKFISLPLTVIVYLACGFLGIRIGSKNAGIIVNLRTGVKESSFRRKATSAEREKERNKLFGAKILDTSVISNRWIRRFCMTSWSRTFCRSCIRSVWTITVMRTTSMQMKRQVPSRQH